VDEVKRGLMNAFYKLLYDESEMLYAMNNQDKDNTVTKLQAHRVQNLFWILNDLGLIEGYYAWKSYTFPCEQIAMPGV